MFGLELSHTVRVEEVIEGDPQEVLQRVAEVTLAAEREEERLAVMSAGQMMGQVLPGNVSPQLDPLSFLFTTLNPRVLSNYRQETSHGAPETVILTINTLWRKNC